MRKKTATSRISSKSQTVIPREIREKLNLAPGDQLQYIETDHGIMIEKARTIEDDPFAAFGEWSSAADEEAYADL
ncbi:antitoxin PrlF [Mesorhizobium sp. J18]|uniref:AbrB/MazE/SpoVT family DNA-binding domain-containing protein n=1 Tax=Mesorhizobium sp. J18 TaxID=935263 RepID=UPI00119C1EB9|nr:AbrB/MazE/SpoVT family DNA-binding domain-containing protein [Mesorhizobium sp. J18]TWG92754.1 antitoxin PrlF [Mesorhizobium sp. J18]